MEEYDIRNRLYSYLFYAAAVFCLVLSLFSFNLVLIIAVSVLLFLSALYLHSGHIVNNLLLKRSGIIELYNGYTLASNLNSASKRVGNEYLSVSAAVMRPNDGIEVSRDALKGLLESIHESFEFGVLVREADKKRMLESLELKRRMKEIQLARAEQKEYDRINMTRREIEILGSEINSIRMSGRAFYTTLKLKTLAKSENELRATEESSRNLEKIADAFSAALNLSYDTLRGEALIDFLEVQA